MLLVALTSPHASSFIRTLIYTCRYAIGKSKVFKKQVTETQVVMCGNLSSLLRTVDWKEREGKKEKLSQKDAFDMIYY